MRKVIPLIIFLVLSASLVLMLRHLEHRKTSTSMDKKTFPAITVTALEGNATWTNAALKGRVTLINFYASWCSPCAEEMPELLALKKQFPQVHLAGVAWNDEPATLHTWLKKYGNPFDSLWLDKHGDATIDLGIKGIPETFVVDSKGDIRWRMAAPLTKDMREGELGALIATLLSEAVDAK